MFAQSRPADAWRPSWNLILLLPETVIGMPLYWIAFRYFSQQRPRRDSAERRLALLSDIRWWLFLARNFKQSLMPLTSCSIRRSAGGNAVLETPPLTRNSHGSTGMERAGGDLT